MESQALNIFSYNAKDKMSKLVFPLYAFKKVSVTFHPEAVYMKRGRS